MKILGSGVNFTYRYRLILFIPVPFLVTGTALFYFYRYHFLFTGTALFYFHRYQFNLYLPEPFFIHWYSFNLYSPVPFFVHRYRFILYPPVLFFIHRYLNFYSFGPGRILFTGPVLIIGSILFTGPTFPDPDSPVTPAPWYFTPRFRLSHSLLVPFIN